MSVICPEKAACQPECKAKPLRLRQILGFNGKVIRGLLVHPDGDHILFTVGANIVIETICKNADGTQEFLSRHTDYVSTLDISPDGRFVASGQENQKCKCGKALVILWDYCERTPLMEWAGHSQKVESLVFLSASAWFVTLGGCDDGNVMVWGVGQRQPLCSHVAQYRRHSAPHTLAASRRDGAKFMTAGRGSGRVWTASPDGRKLDFVDMSFGHCGHDIVCIEIADYDSAELQLAFCGTSSGDIMIFSSVSGHLLANIPKKPIKQGITCVTYIRMIDQNTFNILVGTGEGKVMNLDVTVTCEKNNRFTAVSKVTKDTTVWSNEAETQPVTSIAKLGVGRTFYVGTCSNQMYEFSLFRWSAQLIRTCSPSPIMALTFARGTDDLLVTGEHSQVRVYNLHVNQEVRRFIRANRTCTAVVMNHDGTHIFTGWDNGETIVLGFAPKSLALKELYRVDCSQKQAVTSLALTSESSILVSGGNDGQARVWRLVDDFDLRGQRVRQGLLLHLLIVQKGAITSVQISTDDQKVVCSSLDGSAVVYNLVTGNAMHIMRTNCLLRVARFCNDDLMILTAGADGVLRQWELITGELLREVPAAGSGGVSTLSVRKDNYYFSTGGDDTAVNLWQMDLGDITHRGKAHSDAVIASVFGPCGTVLVTSSKDNSMCVWEVPAVC